VVNHLPDGTREKELLIIEDFKRPYYTTKPEYRTHKQPKEYEFMSRLDKGMCTESDLAKHVAKGLGIERHKGLYDLRLSPYVYGVGSSSEYYLKNAFTNKYGANEPFDFCGFDIETNVLKPKLKRWDIDKKGFVFYDDEEITHISLAMHDDVSIHILSSFLSTVPDPEKALQECYKRKIDQEKYSHLNYTFHIWSDEKTLILEAFKELHEWDPDIVGIHYGFGFDIPYIERRCSQLNIDLADLWSHPDIPRNLRCYDFFYGRKIHVNTLGVSTPILYENDWGNLKITAGFKVVDTIRSYKALRAFHPKQPLNLDYLLKTETDTVKLHYAEGYEHLTGLELHVVGQSQFPLEYSVYSGWDSFGLVRLMQETQDLPVSLPTQLGDTPWQNVRSSSKRVVQDYCEFLRENGRVLSASRNEVDDPVIDGSKWILTLPAGHTTRNGCRLLEEDKSYITNIRLFNYDSDVTASYPMGASGSGASASTSHYELCGVEGTRYNDEQRHRRSMLNLLSGHCNAVDFLYEMYTLPNLDEMVELCS
jgi:uncharacterized protein YprB with RNaseH-like and TPR domain